MAVESKKEKVTVPKKDQDIQKSESESISDDQLYEVDLAAEKEQS